MKEQPELTVREVPVSQLVPYENNAKIHTQKQIGEIAASIEEFGNCDPIAVWHDEQGRMQIVEGHGRLLALKKLGIKKAPVIFLDHLTDEQRRIYTHVHNQTTLSSGFDYEALIEDMDNLNADWDSFGFDEYLYDGCSESNAEDDTEPDTIICRAKRGEVWKLGEHRIMCGDSTDADDLEKLTGGGCCDLLLTDPPYNVALGRHERPSEARQLRRRTDGLVIENDKWETDEGFVSFLESAFSNAMRSMSPGASFYIWHADTQRGNFLRACERAGMKVRECLVWVKNTFTLGRQDYQWKHEPCLYGWKDGSAHRWYSDRRQSTVLEFDKPASSDEHPTMKPVGMMEYLVRNSTKRGDSVLDIFAGSGSTLIACERSGRKCFAMELDPHFCDVIIQRWEDETGGTAVLEVTA